MRKKAGEALGLIGILLILFAVFAYTQQTPFPSLYALVPTIGTVLIIAFARPDTLAGRILGTKPFVAIGLISYSAYLWHQPVFAFARHRSFSDISELGMGVLSLASLIFAYLSWKYIETPFRKGMAISRSTVLGFSILGSIAFLGFGFAGEFTGGFSSRFPKQIEQLISIRIQDFEKMEKPCATRLAQKPEVSSACNIGKQASKPEFMLIGDSHAIALSPSIDRIATQHGISGLTYAYRGCPPLRNSQPINGDHSTPCQKLRKSFFDEISTEKIPDVIVINSRATAMIETTLYDNGEGGRELGKMPVWKNESSDELGIPGSIAKDYADSVHEILATGRKVILVYPIPEMGWDVPSRLARLMALYGQLSDSAASTSHDAFFIRNRRAYAALDSIGKHPNLYRIYPEKIFCDSAVASRCIAHTNGTPLYYDNNHLTELGADPIAQQVIETLEKIRTRQSQSTSE